jgi:N-acetylmuramoyl-L-alanine amidase
VAPRSCVSLRPVRRRRAGPAELRRATLERMRTRTTLAVAGGALAVTGLLLGAVGPAQATSSAHGRVDAGVGVSGTVLVAASGPVPRTWQGGLPVPVEPRWWPRGTTRPSAAWNPDWPRPVRFAPTAKGRLSGLVVAIDPGHNLGNGSHPRQITRSYWVGLTKTCNTTGTATNAGYPESTYAFDVSARLRRLLNAAGATVILTRDRNTRGTYGPCIGARGTLAAQVGAALMVAVHGDGAPAKGRGFHVLGPKRYQGYTDDIYAGSKRLAKAMVAGMASRGLPRATYLSKTIQLRKDTGAINVSDVPTITVETLNMRNKADARRASSAAGRQLVATGLYAGILRFLS